MEQPKTPAWWWAWAAVGAVFWLAVIVVAWHFIAKWW
jgi:hypothetical protein